MFLQMMNRCKKCLCFSASLHICAYFGIRQFECLQSLHSLCAECRGIVTRLAEKQLCSGQFCVYGTAYLTILLCIICAVCGIIRAVQCGVQNGCADPNVVADFQIHAVDLWIIVCIRSQHNAENDIKISYCHACHAGRRLRGDQFPEIQTRPFAFGFPKGSHASLPSANALRFISINFGGTH